MFEMRMQPLNAMTLCNDKTNTLIHTVLDHLIMKTNVYSNRFC